MNILKTEIDVLKLEQKDNQKYFEDRISEIEKQIIELDKEGKY